MNEPNGRPARILVADDTPENLQLLESLLRAEGYQVLALPNGDMALRAAAKETPDLILLDILMPGLNGYEVCQRLKADAALREIPVMFLSALGEPLDKVRAFEAGGLDYMTKPFQMEEVQARVRTHLELSRQRRELQASNEQLRKLERLRDSLTHMIIHDLRSPLTVVELNLELLRDLLPPGDAGSLETLDTAHVHVQRLAEMIAQLLDVDRLEAGRMPLQLSPGDVLAAVRATRTSLVGLTGPREVVIGTDGPVHAWFDPELLGRVLANLYLNACKFTPERAEIRLDVTGESGLVRVAITDRGPVIPEEYREKIFEKFGQVEARKGPASFGIGLAFCRLALHAQGGRIGVSSRPGEGNTFWFTLPTEPRR